MTRLTHTVTPPGLSSGSGWSHIVAGSGTLAFISGQVSVNEENELCGKGNMEQQIRQVYHNLQCCLKELNTDWQHVVKITYYSTSIAEALPLMRAIREEIMPENLRPANTFIEVSALASPDILFEAEAIVIM